MLRHYFTVALRNFRRTPVATLIKLLVLSLGLTCFLVAHSVVTYWRHAEQGFAKADRTYTITTQIRLSDGFDSGPVPRFAANDIDALKLAFPEFETVARARAAGESPVVAGAEMLRLHAAYADPTFLEAFDLPFLAGNARTALGEPGSAVLTDAAALRLFGTTEALGRTFRYDGLVDLTVTGVIGEIPEPSHIGRTASALLRFDVLASWDVGERIEAALRAAGTFGNAYSLAYVVLPEGSRLTRQSLAPRFALLGEIPFSAQRDLVNYTIGMLPINELMASRLDAALFAGTEIGVSVSTLLMILGAMVLAVACINYVNLATAQAIRRAKEVGLRKAIGAGGRQIAVQYLIEATLLTVAAFVLAMTVVQLIAPIIRDATDIDITLVLFSGVGFWLFTLAAVAAATLLAGAYPAFVLSRVQPFRALQADGAQSGRSFLPALLVGIQFAAASFLLIAIIVMQQQTADLRRTGLATDSDPLIVVTNISAFTGVDSATLEEQLRGLPQVTAVAGMRNAPWSGAAGVTALQVTPGDTGSLQSAVTNGVDYDFFSAMQIRLLAGRVFDQTRADTSLFGRTDLNTPASLVIDEAFARQIGFATPQSAIDELIYLPVSEVLQPVRIIGVVENKPLYFTGTGTDSNIYYLSTSPGEIVVRLAKEDIPGALQAVRGVWERLAPDHLFHYEFEDQLFAQGYTLFGHVSRAFAGLAVLAFFICVIGLVGMAGHMTGRRREIGVRKTLGATTGGVLRLLLLAFSKPVIVANLIAWPLAYLAARAYLDIFIHRVPLTPVPFVLSLVVTLIVAWAAVGAQAWRAARVEPAKVLRFE